MNDQARVSAGHTPEPWVLDGATIRDGDGDTFERNGLTFRFAIEHDGDHGAPWDEEEGHGPVSEWRSYDSTDMGKRTGEWLLNSDGRFRARFYDAREAQRIALRDGWGIGSEERAALAARLKREPTNREIAAEAVRRDYERLRAWCNDEWSYVGVVVTLLDVEGDATDESNSIWGIESDAGDYLTEVAHDLADEIAARVGDRKFLMRRSVARTERIRVRA